ncbi:MAG TPA: selenide, water dikinase SelD [Streptosporangiaceae bacterium]|nr:selenide, water dikinase SelD [Streptosporangiaceae bacterium]
MTEQVSDRIRLTSLSHGAGCACKLPMAALDRLMTSLGAAQGAGAGPGGGPGELAAATGDLLVGAAEGDDAAVLRLDDDRALVLTTDFFTPIVDDPRDWGRIAATNAMSDVYAMGGRPVIALNLTAWPGQTLPVELLADVLRGGSEAAAGAGCLVVGGHTIDDPEPKYGLAVVGMADPGRLMTVDRARDGDLLVLTKPVGTGVIATAHKRGAAPDDVLAAAVAAMTTLNGPASEAALQAGVRAATDVTGFGLLGHLHRMLRASGLAAEVWADQVPLLPGAAGLAAAGFISGGTNANVSYLSDAVDVESGTDAVTAVLLHDAQTSGGLLIAVPPAALDGLRADLRGRGTEAALVGTVQAGEAGRIEVRATTPD